MDTKNFLAGGAVLFFCAAFVYSGLLAEPVGGHHGESIQRRAEGFADTFQAVAGPDSREHMGRISASTTASFQAATRLQALQHSIKEDLLCLPGYQPFAKLGED